MRTFLALILTLTGAHCKLEEYGPNMVTGLVEHTVTIPCRYDYQYKYSKKHWCKVTLSNCVDMASTPHGSVNGSRVSIRDERLEGVFYVTMTSLVMEDKGWYKCVMYRFPFFAEHGHNVYLNISVGSGSDSNAVDPTAAGFQTSPAVKIDTGDSSVAGVWAVIRWVLFGLMLACFSAVTWWKRRICSESAPAADHTLQGSDSTHSHV
ncbi:hypothetical protein SKAU_G00054380 [Synaphobranchus kaupii]|uniref:Immunoglobulin domain-containing protein n=1 Tax=Synaphobranchus kaupii TaxID=118154 RepID=A0A9Q1G3K9_SYNKA|nr:hypothetical protein SKAU_G00054380 [Synaphobranchus kaupii]